MSNPFIPDLLPGEEAMSVSAFRKVVNRSRATVNVWCHDGTLLTFGYRTYQDPKRRWWIIRKREASISSSPSSISLSI